LLIVPPMYIVAIAWFYVALMMAVAEGTNSTGTVLGAVITFILYGLLPIALLLYIMATPARRKAIKAREQAPLASASRLPDGRDETPASTQSASVPAVREEP